MPVPVPVSAERIRILNDRPPRQNAGYVLYWQLMNRRVEQNHALAHAAEIANARGLPLLVYDSLTCDYPAANDRLHTFVLEGVPQNEAALRALGVGYFFYLRARHSDPNDVLYRLASRAHAVVTDDYPVFIAMRHNSRVAAHLTVQYLAVDSSCIVPMGVHEKRNYGAYTIRPRIQRVLRSYLHPVALPKLRRKWRDGLLPDGLSSLSHAVTPDAITSLVAGCEIDHAIPPSIEYKGGAKEATRRLDRFLEHRLRLYARESGQPSKHATSTLSPYLHFGHISALEIALAVRAHADEHRLIPDEFLEQLIVRRELAFNFARFAGGPIDSLDLLPDWCKATMAKHAADLRPYLYTLQQFERAETHDALWNAAQRELLLRGAIHNYYRMYWGKKIIEWSPTYEEAFRTMIHLHDVYALDGRDPNTYANILWCFGLHDRPWAERPIFGQLRYMSLEGMKRKTDVDAYIAEINAL
ncbi:MAG TPA: deoxyribodipyrimidine photo-lyase [Bryobacteraceae bacterium]|nr:deoxyribodipyrimidine photo-lyase [Bryobacteraceae bacterium]